MKIKQLPTFLKSLRVSRGLTRAALAKKAGMHRTTLVLAEMEAPKLSTLEKIAKALGRKVDVDLVEK